MLPATILIFAIIAFLGHRILTRIVLPELADKRREEFRDDRAHGDSFPQPIVAPNNLKPRADH